MTPLFPFDFPAKPHGHALGMKQASLASKSFYHRHIEGVHTDGDRLTGRTGNLKRLCIIEQFLNLPRTLHRNSGVPLGGFFLETISCLFWKFAQFFSFLKQAFWVVFDIGKAVKPRHTPYWGYGATISSIQVPDNTPLQPVQEPDFFQV